MNRCSAVIAGEWARARRFLPSRPTVLDTRLGTNVKQTQMGRETGPFLPSQQWNSLKYRQLQGHLPSTSLWSSILSPPSPPSMGESLLSLHCCPQVNDPPQDPASLLPVPPCPHHLLLCSPEHTLYNKITELVTPSFPNTEVTLLIAASAFKFLLIFNYQCRKLAGLSQDEFWFWRKKGNEPAWETGE